MYIICTLYVHVYVHDAFVPPPCVQHGMCSPPRLCTLVVNVAGVRRMTAAPSLEAAHRDISEKVGW